MPVKDSVTASSYKTLLRCRKCGWISEPQSYDDMKNRGVPWYCDRCDENVTTFVRYGPGEEMLAQNTIKKM